MSEENKKDVLNEKKELNENELDKVVGATGYLKGQLCPYCKKETLYYVGHCLLCDSCGYNSGS